ncbi:hypothetical protein OIU76_018656 [Salix suchowensis]|nr:hypothetical protein OIU76_018656 [Salix suchowensis]
MRLSLMLYGNKELKILKRRKNDLWLQVLALVSLLLALLFPYHLGVAHLLIEKGYIKETTPLAGSSAGAIVCATIASGASMHEALRATKILAEDCRLKGTAFRLGAVLRDVLEKFLPDDVHIRSNGRVRVAVTQILWRPRGLLVDQFDSKEDLINAVVTSSFIPGYLAPRPATMFRNQLCIDGGLTLFMPPTSAAKTVRICAFPASRMGLQGIGISPDCNPENRASPRELFNWALEPAEDHVLDRLFELWIFRCRRVGCGEPGAECSSR